MNPFFLDSVLKHKADTSNWNNLVFSLDMHKPVFKNSCIQKQKREGVSAVFLIFTFGIFLLLLVLRLIFDDFSYSLMDGILSAKKFLIFYKSKKYDSLFAVLSVYFLKITILSLLLHIGLLVFKRNDFSVFYLSQFFTVWIILIVFFISKNLVEFIFNRVTDTEVIYEAFFLQHLFAEFLLSIILIVPFLIYIYNYYISVELMLFILIFSGFVYLVFNIVKSYQLISNVRIPYKLHFFLYICAFKIIPVLILVKYILNNFI